MLVCKKGAPAVCNTIVDSVVVLMTGGAKGGRNDPTSAKAINKTDGIRISFSLLRCG